MRKRRYWWKKAGVLLFACHMIIGTRTGELFLKGNWQISAEASEIVITGSCGDDATYSLDDEGLMTISGTGEICLPEDNDEYLKNNYDIRTVVIEDGITAIGNVAFRYGVFTYESKITNIRIPDSVKTIGYAAFLGCRNLTEIEIPDSVESIGYSAFNTCSKIEKIKLSKNITAIEDHTFWGCKKLTDIEIPEGVTSIGSDAFVACQSLERVVIPDSVTSIGDRAFQNCISLTEVELPGDLTDIGEDVFDGCTNLTEIKYREKNTSENNEENGDENEEDNDENGGEGNDPVVKKEGQCGDNLTWSFDEETGSMTISGNGEMWDFENITVGYACPWNDLALSINKVEFQEGITKISEGAFAWCYNLSEVSLCDSITQICPFAFWCCPILSVQLPEHLEYLGQQCFGQSMVEDIVIPDTVTFLDNGFADCQELKHAYIGASPNIYGSGLFLDCPKLEAIEVSPDNRCFKSIDGVLFNKAGTTLEQYPGGKKDEIYEIPEGVTYVKRFSFYVVRNLKTVVFPRSLEELDDANFINFYGDKYEKYIFLGDMPVFAGDGSLNSYGNPTAYYPTDNDTWVGLENLQFSKFTPDGENKITWVAYGWDDRNDGRHYVDYNKGEIKDNWLQVDNQWYYFDSQGIMQAGWKQISGKWYYFDESGVMQTGWKQISGKWYYLSDSGVMQTGWKKINGKWYYLNDSGVMQAGWKQISGKWYYLSDSGAMQTGWRQLRGKWYCFDESGVMLTGLQQVEGKRYYFCESGAMQTGWNRIGEKWYYFNDAGVMQTGWKQISSTWYYFHENGVMAANEWCDGYYLDCEGEWNYRFKANWKKNSTGWWYEDTSGSYLKDSTVLIDGIEYTFDRSGYLVQ